MTAAVCCYILPPSMSNDRSNAGGETNNKDFLRRINRIGGQIDGIKKLIGEKYSCLRTVQQVIAARNALTALAVEMLYQQACRTSDREELKTLLKKLIREN